MIRFFTKIFLLLVAVCCLFVACNKGPKDIIPKKEMSDLMAELAIAEEYARSKVNKDSSLNEKDETIKLYTQVLELHKTSRQEFLKSFDYYLSKPEIARAMFDSLSVQVRRMIIIPAAINKPVPADTGRPTPAAIGKPQ